MRKIAAILAGAALIAGVVGVAESQAAPAGRTWSQGTPDKKARNIQAGVKWTPRVAPNGRTWS